MRVLKHEIKFIIKSNASLIGKKKKKKIENKIGQLLTKSKHRNNIHGHGKQQSEWVT